MTRYKIMREPGPAARRRNPGRYLPPAKLAVVHGEGQLDALSEYVHRAYLGGHRQYAGHRFQWRGAHGGITQLRGWKDWDGSPPPDRDSAREWRCLVTLRNGRNEHDLELLAWKAETTR